MNNTARVALVGGTAAWYTRRWWRATTRRRALALAGWRENTIIFNADVKHGKITVGRSPRTKAIIGNLTSDVPLFLLQGDVHMCGDIVLNERYMPVFGYCGHPIPEQITPVPGSGSLIAHGTTMRGSK